MDTLPVIDIQPLIAGTPDQYVVASHIHTACAKTGFFYIRGHNISENLQNQLEQLSRVFFTLDEEVKMTIRMSLGGRAWRGYFPVGDELTSGKPDQKEGIYFGEELPASHPKVRAGLPLHGANLFPEELGEFRQVVLDYIKALTQLGHHLMRGFSLSLGLPENYFADHFTRDPLVLFRIFHYPAQKQLQTGLWGVGEHTDYGVLTILKQDAVGGLQVKSKAGWIEAPYLPGTFICNIGDMLDRLTQGYYRSTPHRVLNRSGKGRLSFPFFFDPGFDAQIRAIDLSHITGTRADFRSDEQERWDNTNVQAFEGTYGDYVLGKVSRVFPELGKGVL